MHWKLPVSCWEVWTVPLTEFQQEFLRNCSHRWNVKTGATRSGKTYLDCAVTIPKRICAARDEGLCVMLGNTCLLYTSPSPRDGLLSRMPSSA